jgi:hypothetical protein
MEAWITMRDLPYPRNRYQIFNKWKTLQLSANLYVTDGAYTSWVVPTGTPVRIMQSTNFGWCVIPKNTLDARNGHLIPRTIFKY